MDGEEKNQLFRDGEGEGEANVGNNEEVLPLEPRINADGHMKKD